MAEIGQDIQKAVEILRRGELIGMPTETVYGLAGNALNEKTVLEIFKVKNRPKFDPLIIHTDTLDKAQLWIQGLPHHAKRLAEAFWPGPMTMLLEKKSLIPDLVTSGLPRVAIRIPSLDMTRELLSQLDFPVAAPSANPFGFVSPTSAQHVQDQLGDQLSYILDGGACAVGLESTVIGFEGNEVIIHRLGGLQLEQIEEAIGDKVKVQLNQSSNPSAPGMLKSHYSPGKPVIIGEIQEELTKHENAGVISFDQDFGVKNQVVLSSKGDLAEAAAGLFAALRKMRESDVSLILTQKFPDIGLGRAINDRLRRAAAK